MIELDLRVVHILPVEPDGLVHFYNISKNIDTCLIKPRWSSPTAISKCKSLSLHPRPGGDFREIGA